MRIEYSTLTRGVDRKLIDKATDEARREVALLAIAGHRAPRGIVDDHTEFSYTCDYCGLWGYVSHVDPYDHHRETQEERHGSVFTEKCEADAVVKKFGAFDPAKAWDRTPVPYSSPDDIEKSKVVYKKTRKKREHDRLYMITWRDELRQNNPEKWQEHLAKRREYRKRKREEARATTTP